MPGARMPRSSGHGSSTERTAVTAESGTRMSPCTPSAFSIGRRCRTSSSPSMTQFGHGGPSLGKPVSLGPMWPPPPGGTWVVDLDGVVWLAGRPIPGVDEAVARLRGVGVRVLFATNNALPTRAELHRQLAHCGITADDADLLRSADVAAGMLAPGSSAVVLGGDGVLEALAGRGVDRRARGAGRRRRGRPDPRLHLRRASPAP